MIAFVGVCLRLWITRVLPRMTIEILYGLIVIIIIPICIVCCNCTDAQLLIAFILVFKLLGCHNEHGITFTTMYGYAILSAVFIVLG